MKQIAVHHTAVYRTSANQLNGVNNYHRGKWDMKSSLGWFVGYNWFIDSDGTMTQCRADNEETIANVGNNCDVPERCTTISVCFAMDGNQQVFNAAQEKSWKSIVDMYPDLSITRHCDIQANRTCPGKHITVDYLLKLLDDPDNNTEKQEEIERLMKEVSKLKKVINILVGIIRRLRLK